MTAVIFYCFATVAVLFSIGVISFRSPTSSALSLVASFFGVSGIFIMLQAPFVGLAQILIYAGAVLVLFLFVVMLLDLKGSRMKFNRGTWAGMVSAFALTGVAAVLFWTAPFIAPSEVTVDSDFGSMASVGELFLGQYGLAFEILSLLLLAAVVGVVVLSWRKGEEA